MPFDPNSAVAEATPAFDPASAFDPSSAVEARIGPSTPSQAPYTTGWGYGGMKTPDVYKGTISEMFEPFPGVRPVLKIVDELSGAPAVARAVGFGKEQQAFAIPIEEAVASVASPGGAELAVLAPLAPALVGGATTAMAIPGIIEGGSEAWRGIKEGNLAKTVSGGTKAAVATVAALSGGAAMARGAATATPRTQAAFLETELVREIPPERQLGAPRRQMPEFQEGPIGPEPRAVAPMSRQLPAPSIKLPDVEKPLTPADRTNLRAELAEEMGPEMASTAPKAGDRITLPAEPETAKLARKVWSKPIDVEAQVEGADALRQLSSMTEEVKTPGKPYEPPTVNVDLRQLEKMMQKNTVSKVESWADKVIQDKLRGAGANPFLDPEFMAAAMTKGAILFKRGTQTFGEWSAKMREQFGRGLDEQLPVIFKQSEDYWKLRASLESKPTVPPVIPGFKPATPSTAAKLPTVDPSTGAAKPAPSGSAFDSSTPPESDLASSTATKLLQPLRDWWENVWPRSLAATRIEPGTPVITEHQRLLFNQMDYMENFSKEDWWKTIRQRDNEELIAIEDKMVRDYKARIDAGEPAGEAYEAAVKSTPEDVQALVRHRDSRIAAEAEAARELGVENLDYRGEPYIARLTNEEGKAIVDIHPNLPGWTRQIRTSLGSFEKSRTHATMKEGIEAGTQYEPVARAAWIRELLSTKLESTANMLRNLKENGVLYDTREEAMAASPDKQPWKVRGFGATDYWARTRQEAKFLEQNLSGGRSSPLKKLTNLANTYIRNPSLVNPLPHTTKNMLFKYIMARVNSYRLKSDVAEYQAASNEVLKARFNEVMPMTESGMRLPQLTAREVGTLPEKILGRGLMINNPSTKFIFAKADPAMRYSLWKDYVRKGMSDQEAANHVWLDLVRYDENSGGINFWKSIPLNFFVPWRTGTYTTLYKAFTSHPYRTTLFVGAVEYLRELRYRKTGRWTHLPVDYLDAPLAEAIDDPSKVPAVAATTMLFGPGGGQGPTSIRDLMSALKNDEGSRSRLLNMFWGLSQIYNLPTEWKAYQRDGDPEHLVNLMTSAALAEHSALKYEPRRLMKWFPESMPGMERSDLVKQAEELQQRAKQKREKRADAAERHKKALDESDMSPAERQMLELRKSVR